MLAYHRPTLPAPVAGAETAGVFPSESTTMIFLALASFQTERTFQALVAESVNLSFLKILEIVGSPENATVQVPLELGVTPEAVTAILESAPMVYSLTCRALESFALADVPVPLTIVLLFVPALNPPALGVSPEPVSDVCRISVWLREAVIVCMPLRFAGVTLAVLSLNQKLPAPLVSSISVTLPSKAPPEEGSNFIVAEVEESMTPSPTVPGSVVLFVST